VNDRPLRIILVEDEDDDALLVAHALRRDRVAHELVRVTDEPSLRAALAAPVDVVLSDYSLPRLSGAGALAIVRGVDPSIPFVVVSGTIGETTAVEMTRAGANDYLLKSDLRRLAPAVLRALDDAEARRARERAEHALASSVAAHERQLRLLMRVEELADVGGFDYRVATRKLHWTDGVYRLYGAKPGDVEPSLELVSSCYDPDDFRVARALLDDLLSGRRDTIEHESEITRFDGRRAWHRWHARAQIEDGKVAGLTGALMDTTARREAHAKLMVADRLGAMGLIAAGVVHEINNPLTFLVASLPTAVGIVERLCAGRPVDESDRQDAVAMLRDARDGAERIALIARDLRLFSRMDDDLAARCELSEVLASVARMVRATAKSKARIVIDASGPYWVRGASARIAQVLTNLLVNAVQAFPSEDPSHNVVRVEVDGSDASCVRIEVRDNGPGVPPELAARIFEPFFTTKPAGEGTGLGLAVCRQIIEAVGGALELVAHPTDRGACFRVTLARADGPRTGEVRAAAARR
jgi:two-component system NtrC family sensor kinase